MSSKLKASGWELIYLMALGGSFCCSFVQMLTLLHYDLRSNNCHKEATMVSQ